LHFKNVILIICILSQITIAAEENGEYIVPETSQKKDSLSVVSSSKWFAPDKGRHLVGSMISTVFIGKLSQQRFDQSMDNARVWGAGMTLSLGVAKEIFDSQSQGNWFDFKDLAVNMVGIAIGILLLGVK
jgi:uncharacterized protein YfiM (DUF2279 family)